MFQVCEGHEGWDASLDPNGLLVVMVVADHVYQRPHSHLCLLHVEPHHPDQGPHSTRVPEHVLDLVVLTAQLLELGGAGYPILLLRASQPVHDLRV